MSVEPGRRLGRYRIESEVGRGAMGHVYRALDEELGRTVAIKVLPPYLTDAATFVDRFRREARTAAGLRHHGIVAIFDVGLDQGLHYLVMEFLPGRNLADLIAEHGPLEPRRALSLVRQVGSALDHAHQRGVIHRDVKPANIIVSDAGHATLTDFGIAYAAASERLTTSGGIIGTPAYIAPEQALGRPVDGRTDLYALGVVLWETLAGSVPFEADSAPAVLLAHAYHTPPAIRDLRPELPPAVERVLDRALAKDPAERYASGAELADALETALFPEAKPRTLIQGADVAADTQSPAISPAPLAQTRVSAHPGLPRDRASSVEIDATPGARWSRGGARPTTRGRYGSQPDTARWKGPVWGVGLAVGLALLVLGIWRISPFTGGSTVEQPGPQPTAASVPTAIPGPATPAGVAAQPAAPPPAPPATAPPAIAAVVTTGPAPSDKVASPAPTTVVPTRPGTVPPTATVRPPPTPTAASAAPATATPASQPTGRPTAPPVLLPPQPTVTPAAAPAPRTSTAPSKPAGPAVSPTPGPR